MMNAVAPLIYVTVFLKALWPFKKNIVFKLQVTHVHSFVLERAESTEGDICPQVQTKGQVASCESCLIVPE